MDKLPDWAAALPAVNACLNALAGVMLVTGYVFIKRKQQKSHAWMMVSSYVTSAIFLVCYLTYHTALRVYTGQHGRSFGHSGTPIAAVYFVILVTHVILAVAVALFLAPVTLYRAWKQDWLRHRRIAVITFPIWVYVSVTGVIIYVMLYHWPGAAA